MTLRTIFSGLVIAGSIGLMILKFNIDYADMVGHARYLRSFFAGLVPWSVGLIVAAIKAFATRNRPSRTTFRDTLEGAVFVLLLLLYAITLTRTPEG